MSDETELRAEVERLGAENALLRTAAQAHRIGALLQFGSRLAALGTLETPMRVLVHGPCGIDFRIEHAR